MKKLTKKQKIIIGGTIGLVTVIAGYVAYKYFKLPNYKDVGNLLKDDESPVPLQPERIYIFDKYFSYPEDPIPGKEKDFVGWVSGFSDVRRELEGEPGFIFSGDLKINPKHLKAFCDRNYLLYDLICLKDGEVKKYLLTQKLGLFKALATGAKSIIGYIPIEGKRR